MDEQIRAYLAGDRTAGEQLLRQRLPRIRSIVRGLVRRQQDVDDVSQQVLVEVIRSLSTYRAEAPFTAWVDKITVRVTLHWLRRSRVRSKQEQPSETLGDQGWPEPRPDGSAERRVDIQRALSLLDQLPDEQRAAVFLHHVLGLSVAEVAGQEATGAETIRSRLRIGMGKLRTWTSEQWTLAPPGEVS